MHKAIEGATYVIHVATPITGDFENTDRDLTIVKPAVDGTLSAMRGCLKHGVKKIVITSSVAACSYGLPDQTNFTVADWTNINGSDVTYYAKSKTLAE